MIFRPGLVEKILAGKKTMTRRPVRDHELACPLDAGQTAVSPSGCRYTPGRTYAIQTARGRPAIEPRILVTAIELQELGEITPRDAIAEGFKTTGHFYAHWQQTYGTVDPGQLVWAITFQLERAAPARLLAADSSHGYTTDPARALGGEPEAIDATTLDRYAAENRARFDQEHAAAIEERVVAALREARRLGVNTGRYEAAFEQRVRALERVLRKARAA